MNYEDLKIIGLSDNEAKIYLAILELGEAIASRISQKSQVKRTTIYLSLRTLKDRGLIGQAKKFGQMRYFAEDPKRLTKLMNEKKEKLDKLMPEILSIVKMVDQKPSVRYFEGRKAAKQVYDSVLEQKNIELLSLQPSKLSENEFYKEFNEKRLAKKVMLKTIASEPELKTDSSQKERKKLQQTKPFPHDLCLGETEIILYGKNKIGIIVMSENLGIIIESQGVHTTFKNIFNALWNKL